MSSWPPFGGVCDTWSTDLTEWPSFLTQLFIVSDFFSLVHRLLIDGNAVLIQPCLRFHYPYSNKLHANDDNKAMTMGKQVRKMEMD